MLPAGLREGLPAPGWWASGLQTCEAVNAFLLLEAAQFVPLSNGSPGK